MKAKEIIKLYADGELNASKLLSIEDSKTITLDYNRDLDLNNLPQFQTAEEFFEYMEQDESIYEMVRNLEWDVVDIVLLRTCEGDRNESRLLTDYFEDGSYWDEDGYNYDLVSELLEYIIANGYVEVEYTNLPYKEWKVVLKMEPEETMSKYRKIYAVSYTSYGMYDVSTQLREFNTLEEFNEWLNEEQYEFRTREYISKTKYEDLKRYLKR